MFLVVLIAVAVTASATDDCPAKCVCNSNLADCDFRHAKDFSEFSELNLTSFKVTELNLSGNQLDFIPENSFVRLNSLKSLDLSINNLTSINNIFNSLGNLQHLNLSWNELKLLGEDSLIGLTSLQLLDLSHNKLLSLTAQLQASLIKLVISFNEHLNLELFVGTQRLQIVEATSTNLQKIPETLTHSIRSLKLSKNSIKFINRGDFDSYPLLQLLDMEQNGLQNLEEDSLGRLEALKVLYLNSNKLTLIPRSLPEKLVVLHLEFNEILSVDANELNLPHLEVLLLQFNKINAIKNSFLSNLPALVNLDLSNNPIHQLPAGTLPALKILKLSHLKTFIEGEENGFPLNSPENLIVLELEDSASLAKAFLENTALVSASRSLQELNLIGNEIETLRSDLLYYAPQLRVLKLRGNPLNCTGLQWLANWMRKEQIEEDRGVFCESPGELWGTPLIDLQSFEIEEVFDEREDINVLKASNLFMKESTGFTPRKQNTGFDLNANLNHPGIIILLGTIVTCVSLLGLSKFNKHRKRRSETVPRRNFDSASSLQTLNSLPSISITSVSELW